MKNRKEFIILIVIIAALGLYLATRHRGEVHYQLPKLPKIKVESVNRIVVKKPDGKVELKRENDQWKLLPEGFPAKTSEVKRMAEALAHLKLTALAGESGGLSRYMLDDPHKIVATAFDGDRALRTVTIGKATSTWRHTFVQLPDNPRVYHAADNLRSVFDITVDRLRDKTVLKVDKSTVTKITLAPKKGTPVVITRDMNQAGDAKARWLNASGEELDGAPITRLINAFTSLECSKFLKQSEKDKLKKPSFELTVEAGGTTKWLKFFDRTDKDEYRALSSDSDYPFLLPKWKADQLMKTAKDFPVKPKSKTGTQKGTTAKDSTTKGKSKSN